VSQLETQTGLASECCLRKDFRPLRLPDVTTGDDFISIAHRISADSTTRSTTRRRPLKNVQFGSSTSLPVRCTQTGKASASGGLTAGIH
jgi:hypothetical protein